MTDDRDFDDPDFINPHDEVRDLLAADRRALLIGRLGLALLLTLTGCALVFAAMLVGH